MGALTFAYTPAVMDGIPVISARLLVSLEDIFTGTSVMLTISAEHVCSKCNGSRLAHANATATCPVCGGRGKHAEVSNSASVTSDSGEQTFFHAVRTRCSRCSGSGRVVTHNCPVCQGVGTTSKTKQVNVTIPAGHPNVSLQCGLRFLLSLSFSAGCRIVPQERRE